VSTQTVPVFLLPTVLFPDGHLPLKIFEPRYIDMVRECCANQTCFAACLLDPEQKAGQKLSHMRVGTLAEITDFSTLENGLLGITSTGRQRFLIQHTRMRDNGLMVADVSVFEEPGRIELPEEFSVLSMICARFMEELGERYPQFTPDDLQDASWVGYRLAELLPYTLAEKQVLLQVDDALERLQLILDTIPQFQMEA
jgi:Lon protease-like protein